MTKMNGEHLLKTSQPPSASLSPYLSLCSYILVKKKKYAHLSA